MNAGQSQQYSDGIDWNGSHPSCCCFGWSLPSRLTVQYCVCFFISTDVGCVARVYQQRYCLATYAEVWVSEKSDHSPKGQTIDPNGQGHSFHLSSLSVREYDPPRRLPVPNIVNRLLADGFQSRFSARCHRLNHRLNYRRRRRLWRKTHWRWDLRHWRQCVFNDELCFTLFHSDGRACVRCE